VADSDMGWHLATGRWILQHHQIPRTDVLSFPSAGKPWTYPPFAGVLLYLTYRGFGYVGLSLLCALACLAVVAIFVRRGDFASAFLAMLAVPCVAARTAPRADLFSTVFFAIFICELWAYQHGKRVRLWLLPVLMLLWVNLHPGFVAGLAAIGAYLLLEVTDLIYAERRAGAFVRLRGALPWLAACAVATLANPWGGRIYAATLNMMGVAGSVQGTINGNVALAEFAGIPITTHMLHQLLDVRDILNGFTWLLLLSVLLAGLFLWKRQIGAALLLVFALSATLTHARYMGLFAITVVTLGATLLEELFTSASDDGGNTTSPRLQVPAGVATLIAVVLCAVALLHVADFVSNRSYVVFSPGLSFGAGESSWFPSRAAAFIRREQLPGNVFEDYELGGYAAWSLGPKYPDFIDGRGNSGNLGLEQFNLYSEDPDSPAWKNEAEHWKLNVLLVSTVGLRSLQQMDPFKFCQSKSWRPIYMDDVSLVLLRDSPQNAPWINRLQIDCFTQPLTASDSSSRPALHQFYLNSGALFYDLHRDREAQESLSRAAALYREDPSVHFLSALLFERGQRYAEAEQEYRASLAITETSSVWYSLSLLYGKQGRTADALHALEHAAELSMQPYNIYVTMGKLQMVLNNPEQSLVSFAKAERNSPYRNGAESLAPEVYAELDEYRSEAHRRLSHWNEAIRFQQEAIQRTPLVVRRWDRLARLYEATGQMPLASQVRQHIFDLQTSENSTLSSSPAGK